jgi:tetratricopeptide (TPR) repeat protein
MTRAAIAVAVLVLCARGARADEPSPQTKAAVLFEQGQADYEAGKYQAAIELFQRAYELVNDPVYLFNVAQSYRKVLDCDAATTYYKRYLDEAPAAENRAKVQQWIVELEPCVERAHKDHEAQLQLEQLERQRREDEARKRAAAARPIETEVDRCSASQRDGARPGEAVACDRGRPFRIAGYVAAGVGVIGVGVAIAYSDAGSSASSDLAAKCKTGCNYDDPSVRGLDSDGKHDNTMAAIGWIGGGVAVAAGAALYFYGRARIEHVVVAPAPGGATVGARLSF